MTVKNIVGVEELSKISCRKKTQNVKYDGT